MNERQPIDNRRVASLAAPCFLATLVLALFLGPACKPKRVETVMESVPEAVEAIVSDDVQEQREILRPVRGEQRLLLFAIDGLGRDEMAQLLIGGNAPVTQGLLGNAQGADGLFERGYLASDTLTVLPSSTIAAWSSIFTGAVPAVNGIPGNEFFLRDTGRFYAVAPTSVASREHALQAVNDGLLNDLVKAPTFYERADLRSHVSLSQIYRGADVYTIPESALVEFVVSTTRSPLSNDEIERSPYEALDSESFEGMKEAWSQHGLPDIQVVYLPGLDLYSHSTENALEKQPDYYREVIDVLVGKVLNVYRKAGILENTWVVFVSDHGHTPVLPDKDHALEVEDFEKQFEEVGYTLRRAFLEIDDQKFSAVLAAQGGLGYVYLADRSLCQKQESCAWSGQPRWKEDVLPVVEMLEQHNRSPEGLNGKLEMILTRDPADPDAPYQVFSEGRLHPIEGWFKSHELDHHLEFASRLRDLTEGPYGDRAGAIILVPRYGMQLPENERYYFSLPVESEHGSATEEDSRFTLLVSRADQTGEQIEQVVTDVMGTTPHQKDVVPLLLKLLDVSDSAGPSASTR